jgi:Mg2+/Co2+ transporter CorC
MKVIRQKRPGINLNTTLFREKSESRKEIVSILIGQEDRPFLDASTHDMMENTRSV